MAAYRRVYDLRHLQADCKEPGSAPEPYARQPYVRTESMGRCVRCRFVTWSGVPVMSARIKPPLVSACSEPLPGAAAAAPPPPRHVERTISSLQQTVATQNARIAELEQKLGDLDELLARCVRRLREICT